MGGPGSRRQKQVLLAGAEGKNVQRTREMRTGKSLQPPHPPALGKES